MILKFSHNTRADATANSLAIFVAIQIRQLKSSIYFNNQT